MAKGARASTIKENNRQLKSRVFGPIENARTERLAAKLLELVSQPKPARPAKMDIEASTEEKADGAGSKPTEGTEMDVDGATASTGRGRIQKKVRYGRKPSIVFPGTMGRAKKPAHKGKSKKASATVINKKHRV